MKFTMTKIAAAAVLAFAATGAHAVSVSTGGVFNMYSQGGLDQAGIVGSNPAMTTPINVDSGISGFVDYAAGTWGVSSTNVFYGLNWTASSGNLISAAGTYSLNTASGAVTASGSCGAGFMCFDVGANQLGGTIDFAWGATTGIRVVNVWNINPNGSLTAYMVPGMENGPFPGFNAAFNLTAANLAPIPEASTYGMMLAGLGLVGFAVRRRKLMA